MPWRRFQMAFLASCCFATAAQALDTRFAGGWRIDGAAAAPWAAPGEVDAKEARALVGKRVFFGVAVVSAPPPIGCRGPHYRIREDGPDMLFEGMLAAPDKTGKPRDAAEQAKRLGITTATVATLETGCSEIAFHALGPDRLLFALDNQIYTLARR